MVANKTMSCFWLFSIFLEIPSSNSCFKSIIFKLSCISWFRCLLENNTHSSCLSFHGLHMTWKKKTVNIGMHNGFLFQSILRYFLFKRLVFFPLDATLEIICLLQLSLSLADQMSSGIIRERNMISLSPTPSSHQQSLITPICEEKSAWHSLAFLSARPDYFMSLLIIFISILIAFRWWCNPSLLGSDWQRNWWDRRQTCFSTHLFFCLSDIIYIYIIFPPLEFVNIYKVWFRCLF